MVMVDKYWPHDLPEAEQKVSLLNEPIDFAVDFAVEEPKRESATERALRIWFKQNPDGSSAS